ncbi:MAG: DNA-3-methyladenine glycosylase 2 family protein [Alphaproteobacteria bacterium]|nr:DNA-3-methyladenine glycosylase 2 family protein [Alphaproteobacteria bacterium]
MIEKQDQLPLNFWLEGETELAELPEIRQSLRHLRRHHPLLAAAYAKNGILPWKKQPEGFEGLVNIILAQQISTAVATHLVRRMKAALPDMTPRRLMKLDDDAFRAMGVSRQKILYLRHLAEAMISRRLVPAALGDMPQDDAFAALTALKGIGLWSAEIYLMFSLGRADIWPAGDIALQKGLQNLYGLPERPSSVETRQHGDAFAPHRSAASLIVWRT